MMQPYKYLCISFILFIFSTSIECSLFFPASSTYGIFAAIAVPLDLPSRNVFVSYNFEANYNMPELWGIPPVYNGAEDDEEFSVRKINCSNCTEETTKDIIDSEVNENEMTTTTTEKITTSTSFEQNETQEKQFKNRNKRESNTLISRTNFYRIISDKLKRSGFDGKACLLRLICETQASDLGAINGVIGSLLHIMFTPSSSEGEGLSLAYYQAEHDGLHDQCAHYESACQESVLDLISVPFDKILKQIESNML